MAYLVIGDSSTSESATTCRITPQSRATHETQKSGLSAGRLA
jgi:hypothetical protein